MFRLLFRLFILVAPFAAGFALSLPSFAQDANENRSFKIGWAEADITLEEPVILTGQFHARVSEGIRDPLTATAMAIESTQNDESVQIVLVSCDLLSISECILERVRDLLREELPELDPNSVIINATHTHTAPYHYTRPRYRPDAELEEHPYGVELPAMTGEQYVDFASRRIADAIIEAWNGRHDSGMAYGLGHAVVGRNRIMAYRDGRSQMYGRTNIPTFSHVEGYEDHSVNIMAVYNTDGELTGMIVNIAAPSQLYGSGWEVSADFWHETREELRRRFGEDLFIIPQCSAAGDQNARPVIDRSAEQRMWQLAGRTHREEIASRIADAVERTLPLIENEIDWNPVCRHHMEMLELPRRIIPEKDVQSALREADGHQLRYQDMLRELEQNPEMRDRRRWYVNISRAYRNTRRGASVERRFREQQEIPNLPVEVHAVRLGDVGFVTNPFELYIDYGMRIKGRSPATQTFIVQLAGPGSYLPTARSIEGGAYGAVPASTETGVEGGEKLVEWSVNVLQNFWNQQE